jgi:hypothetical protein
MNPNAGRPLSTLEESRLTPRFCLPYASRFLFGGQRSGSSSQPELKQATVRLTTFSLIAETGSSNQWSLLPKLL